MSGQYHEFCIMPEPPVSGKRYDEYEPHKYSDIITIHDDDLLTIDYGGSIDFFWHTTDISGKGLAAYGITLISPDAAQALAELLPADDAFLELGGLLRTAISQNKYVIHFGI